MPIPFILGGIAAVAAVTGIAKGVSGTKKMNDAKESIDKAKERDEQNTIRYNGTAKHTQEILDSFGKLELETLQSFQTYYDLTGRIKNLPTSKFPSLCTETTNEYKPLEIQNASVGAGEILAGLGTGVATGGAFAAIAAGGAASAAVTACSTLGVAASTGTAIASLSGAAATNATLAALGGGAIAAGGGGIALGSMILGAGTLGIGLLVGGLIANSYGDSLSEKAEEAWKQVNEREAKINKTCAYLDHLATSTEKLQKALQQAGALYQKQLKQLDELINRDKKISWRIFQEDEKVIVENLDLLVRLLYKMTSIKPILKKSDDDLPQVNDEDISRMVYAVNKLQAESSKG